METYIKQLIEDLEAVQNKSVLPLMRNDGENIPKTNMGKLSGLEKYNFPPVEKLSNLQMQDLVNAIVSFLESKNYIVNLPERLPVNIYYQKLMDKWTDDIEFVENGLLGLEFCPEDPSICDMREWCDWFCAEINPDDYPVYNGIFDYKGNKIDQLSIPVPELCLSCENFLVADWEEVLLCDMTRAGLEEGEEFKCYAWRRREK